MKHWTEFTPEEAKDIDLSVRLDIEAPLTQFGDRCPWPWEPQTLSGQPMGMYHCGYCGEMVLAGVPHVDYKELNDPDGPEAGDSGGLAGVQEQRA